jgi:hypothetical protein
MTLEEIYMAAFNEAPADVGPEVWGQTAAGEPNSDGEISKAVGMSQSGLVMIGSGDYSVVCPTAKDALDVWGYISQRMAKEAEQ